VVSLLLTVLVYREYYGPTGIFAYLTHFVVTNAVISICLQVAFLPALRRHLLVLYTRWQAKDGSVDMYQG
jgi:hypothetical protein